MLLQNSTISFDRTKLRLIDELYAVYHSTDASCPRGALFKLIEHSWVRFGPKYAFFVQTLESAEITLDADVLQILLRS